MNLCVVVLLCFTKVVASQEILGCGGFVKSDVSIDFSQIEIQLLTAEGILKYQTECAPNNGYFMVPFVDKGDFVLKIQPPKGWIFDPMTVDLHVDGITDPCTKGQDINFLFKGFMVTGQILTVGSSSTGPKDLVVALVKDQTTLLKTTTTEDGSYAFNGVLPGKYEIVASHPSYTFKKSQTKVTVANNNIRSQNDIIVSGFDVHGHVSAQGQPVSGVHLLLFTNTKLKEKVGGCSVARPSGSEQVRCDSHPIFVCATTSGADGSYVFPSLPPALYSILPYHREDHMQFDVEPQELKFSVQNSRVDHSDGFKVTGFSVQGRVLNSAKGKPVSGAKVMIGDKEQDVTNAEGYYTLKHMHSGMVDVSVVMTDINFPTTKMRVGPDTPLLPNIIADSFLVCGKLTVDEPPSGQFSFSKIQMSVSDSTEKSKPKATSLDKKGEFCAMLRPGQYTLKPVLTKAMEDGGLVVTPTSQQLTVKDEPVKSVAFGQFRGNVQVDVSCIETCKDVKVELISKHTSKKIKQIVASNEKNAAVKFSGILPGKYAVSVSHDNWCWASDSSSIEVPHQAEDKPTTASFQQSGYQLVCSISHDIELKIHYTDVKVESFPLKKGHNRLCLSRTGEYLLEPVSCHRFDIHTPLKYNTARPKAITLQAVAHEAVIAMETKQKLDDVSKATVTIKSSKGKATKEHMTLSEDNTESGGSVIYKLSYWGGDGEKLEITPSSSLLLFEPPTSKVTMKSSQCSTELVRFQGIVGTFVSGQVTPALANVDIAIAIGGTDKVIHLKTDKKGKYKEGPLHPDNTYTISATMEDYVMTKVEGSQGDFVAKKLSKLVFKIEMEKSDVALPGVLLSISGGDNYRSNNLTGDDGTLTLTKLEPGQYYFKAMMKEYKFNPSAQVIDIAEGAETQISIRGKRVAFSVMGTVTSLNGEPEQDIPVRASSKSSEKTCVGLIEEGISGNDGRYRVRGLRPGCVYDVTVHDVTRRFSHVTPEVVTLEADEHDHEGLRFIAFRQLSGFELSGNVITPVEFLPFIKMVLYRANDSTSSHPVHTVSLTRATPFFNLPTLPRDESEYVLKLESSLATSVYEFTAPAAGFFAVGPHKHITFKFEPQEKKIDAEIPNVSVFTLPFTLLVIFLAYNYSQVLQYLQIFVQILLGKREIAQEPRSGRKKRN
uniref:Nodal modulator 1 n=1 Tax=Phallusia mammillata TaxID=59560 RepID=A0A6F9DMI7_9ASCI|nr:nodal modulator 1 [Phallusia mammillata]